VEHADTLLIMNQPSYDKFHPLIIEGGQMLLNSSMIALEAPPAGVRVISIPATDIANDLGEVRAGNMVMLGALSAVRDYLPREDIEKILSASLTGRKAKLLDLNLKAIAEGYSFAAGRGA
jgi:2-oxoglutarate ferredoxin oxidoreductase subunit gamma